MSEPAGLDLRTFLQAAEAAGERVVHVGRRVSPIHELSAVFKAFEREGSPIVIFDDVDGTEMPVVEGVFASRQRIALALGLDVASLADGFLDRLSSPIAPELGATAPVQATAAVGDAVDLDALPICVHAPRDGGRYITSGVCLARDLESGAINAGIYRTMVKAQDRLTLSIDPGQDLETILIAGRERGQPVDVAIVVGGHPAIAIASQAKVPMSVDSLAVAGALLSAPLRVAPGMTVDLPIPANADVVIEGRVLPAVAEAEGPFGEFSYYYGSSMGWVCQVTAITTRADAMWLDIHPTHSEHRTLAIVPAREARLLRALRNTTRGVGAVHIPIDSAGMIACISVRKRHDGEPRQLAMTALGIDTMLKHVVIVDADIDVFDTGQVAWALAVRLQADRDVLIIPYAKGFAEDPSSYGYASRLEASGLVTKTAIDATMPLEGQMPERADLLPEPYADIDLRDYQG